jgi:hypothetical protein
MTPETTARDVTELYRQLEVLGIEIWIDGGWGVDALLGELVFGLELGFLVQQIAF